MRRFVSPMRHWKGRGNATAAVLVTPPARFAGVEARVRRRGGLAHDRGAPGDRRKGLPLQENGEGQENMRPAAAEYRFLLDDCF